VELTGYEGIDLVLIDVDNPVLRAEALTGVPPSSQFPGNLQRRKSLLSASAAIPLIFADVTWN
jgi:hypothetical protein